MKVLKYQMTRSTQVIDNGAGDVGKRRPSPIDIHVGSRVRFRRMLFGMSQEKLGERLGLTFQQVQKYEKAVNRIGASRLFALSHVLQVPVQFFFDELPGAHDQQSAANGGGLAERSQDNVLVEFLGTRDGLELNRAFLRVSDIKVRRSIVDLVRNLDGTDA
jgi:transcriptional regulator with XRE-family HTH domain